MNMEKAVLSRRSVAELHRQNCQRTRPVNKPWMKRLAIPGPSTSAWLCIIPDGGSCGGEVELDMMTPSPRGAVAAPVTEVRSQSWPEIHSEMCTVVTYKTKRRINNKGFLYPRGRTHLIDSVLDLVRAHYEHVCLTVGSFKCSASFWENGPNTVFFFHNMEKEGRMPKSI